MPDTSAPDERVPDGQDDVPSARWRRWLGVGAGVFILIAAIPIAIITPIFPIGPILSAAGLSLIVRNSRRGRRWIHGWADRLAAKYPKAWNHVPDVVLRTVLGKDR